MKMTVVGEKNKETHTKKEKKVKNGKEASLQKTNDVINDGSPAKMKKQKKSKQIDVAFIDLEESCVGGNEKKKKKKKTGTESLKDAKSENEEEIMKKKKKKKKTADREDEVEAPLSVVTEEHDKEKKKKKKSALIKSEQKDGEEELPKKAKKRRSSVLFVSTEEPTEQRQEKKKKKNTDEEASDAVEGKLVAKKDKKAKKKAEDAVRSVTPEEETGEVEQVKKKKRSKTSESQKVQKEEHEEEVDTAEIRDKDVMKKKDKSTNSKIVTVEQMAKRRKTAEKASEEVTEVEEQKKKKKRKKQKSEVEEEPLLEKCVKEQSGEGVAMGTDRKHKRKKSAVTVDAPEKKIKEDLNESSQADEAFRSAKSGNTDGVTVNQNLGQWSTAQFDSSEQQKKFLRLMGGFKKGFQPAAGHAPGPNMALGKDGQQQLQQGLLGEFERAHSRRLESSNRGAGLGFNAPSNKKFVIDINASRSVRFDD